MLSRLLSSLEYKILNSSLYLFRRSSQKYCFQSHCKFHCNHKFCIRNHYERATYKRISLICFNPRTYTSQVDAQKNETSIENIKKSSELQTKKKINVKLKASEFRRLLSLAQPEKFTLAGTIIILNKNIVFKIKIEVIV